MNKSSYIIIFSILTAIVSLYGVNYYFAWTDHEDIVVNFVPKVEVWVQRGNQWVVEKEDVVIVGYYYSTPNPDRGVNILGFPNDRCGGWSCLKCYYDVPNHEKVVEAQRKGHEWLKTDEGVAAIENARKFHKK